MPDSARSEEEDGLIANRVRVSSVRVAPAAAAASDSGDEDASGSEVDRDLNVALEQVGWGRFQQWTLLPITGLTLMADAMVNQQNSTELMLLPFLTLGVECEWGSAASSSGGSSNADSVGDVESSLLSTSVFAGMLVGALLSGLLSDRIGRRWTVLLMTGLTGVFGLASALAPTFRSLLLFRTLVGLGVGGSPAALALFAEFLPPLERGRHLVSYMCYFSSGAVLEVILAWALLNSLGWRALLLVSALPALVLTVVAAIGLPESPGWLLARGRRREAAAILRKAFEVNHPELKQPRDGGMPCPMHKEHNADAPPSLENESETWDGPLIPCTCLSMRPQSQQQQDLERDARVDPALQTTSSSSSSPKHPSSPAATPAIVASSQGFLRPIWLVFSPELRTLSILLSTLFFLMAFVYYSLVLMSLSFVQDQQQHQLKQCTLRDDQYLQLLAANVAEFPGLFLCFLLLDRVGRRLTITYMFLATAACVALIPVLWATNSCSADDSSSATTSPTSATPASSSLDCPLSPLFDWFQSTLLFLARACSLAFNQSLWIYTTELYPASVRSSGLGLTTLFARVGGGLSPWVCQWLFWRSRYLSVGACVAAALVAAAIAANMPRDTKGSEMQVRLKTTNVNDEDETLAKHSEVLQLHSSATAASLANDATPSAIDFTLSGPPQASSVVTLPLRGQADISPPPPLNLDLLRAAVNDDDASHARL